MKRSHYILVASLSAVFLSACGQVDLPEDILMKTKQAIVSFESGQMELTANLTAVDSDELNLEGSLSLSLDKISSQGERNFELHLMLSGVMEALGESVTTSLDFQAIHLDSEYYVQLNEFSSTDEDLQLLLPIVNLYLEKWLRIDNDSIPDVIRPLETATEIDQATRDQLKQLFVESDIFVINEDHGTKKVTGGDAFHLSLGVNPEGFRNYLNQASVLNDRSFSTMGLEGVIASLAYVESIDVYINTETYNVHQATIKMSTAASQTLLEEDGEVPENNPVSDDEVVQMEDEDGQVLELELVFEASDYNQPMDLKEPESFEDFSPLNLLMGLGSVTLPEIDDTLQISGSTSVIETGNDSDESDNDPASDDSDSEEVTDTQEL